MTTERPREILVPTDFSEAADAAKDYALMLAAKFDATIHFLHVLPEAHDLGEAAGGTQWSELIEHARQNALERFDRLLDRNDRIRARMAIEFGRPAARIVDYANAHGIDLIVMGSHGRSMLETWWFGSVVQGVLLRASSPVLTVRPRHRAPGAGDRP